MAVTDFDEALSQARRTYLGRVDEILDALDATQRRKVEKALRDVSLQHGRIARALNAMGHKVAPEAVKNWRRRMQVIS